MFDLKLPIAQFIVRGGTQVQHRSLQNSTLNNFKFKHKRNNEIAHSTVYRSGRYSSTAPLTQNSTLNNFKFKHKRNNEIAHSTVYRSGRYSSTAPLTQNSTLNNFKFKHKRNNEIAHSTVFCLVN